jgi:signal transduction histidine kinase
VTSGLQKRTEAYANALRDYFESGGEGPLLEAYQLGREVLGEGRGVLELVALHQEALVSALLRSLAPEEGARIARRASEFFGEALAPFEMNRRSFQEVTASLRDRNDDLRQRVETVLLDFEAARSRLDEHEKMERMKDEFISVVSHELRTPLTSIHGSLGLLAAGLANELSPRAAQLLEVAQRNSQRLVRLVGDILDLQKIEAGTMPFELRLLDVGLFLAQALEANQAYGNQFGVTFVLGDVEEGLLVRADPDRLMQVITNLLSNAARFSPPDHLVRISARGHGAFTCVTVTDYGPGIPESFRSRVFERFSQANPSPARGKGGTGLGLSISKAIMEHMGGSIHFDSEVGVGTSFHVELVREPDGGSVE